MFDFLDKTTNVYKNYSTFINDDDNTLIDIRCLEKNDFPYKFVENVDAQKVFKKENFLSQEECEYLVWIAETEDNWPKGASSFWEERNLGIFTHLHNHRYLSEILKQLCLDIHDGIKQFVSESFGVEVFADQIVLVRWPPGSFQMTHIDAVPDKERVAGSVLFLNDDYDGGEPFYPYYGIKLSPEQGMVYAHDAGHSHLHGVTRIRGKTRYTISSTWTSNPSKSPYATGIYAKENRLC
jgi:hypothetical protein